MREDLTIESLARQRGWSVTQSRGGYPYVLRKGDLVLWECLHDKRLVWACAEVTNGQYKNHRYHQSLAVALDMEV